MKYMPDLTQIINKFKKLESEKLACKNAIEELASNIDNLENLKSCVLGLLAEMDKIKLNFSDCSRYLLAGATIDGDPIDRGVTESQKPVKTMIGDLENAETDLDRVILECKQDLESLRLEYNKIRSKYFEEIKSIGREILWWI